MIYDFFFFRSEVTERDVGTHTHLAGNVFHKRPHQRAPRRHGPLIDGERVIWDDGGGVHGADDAGAVAAAARADGVEGELLCPGSIYPFPAHRTEDRLLGSNVQGRLEIVTVGAAVTGQPREHKSQAVKQFRHCTEGAAYTGNAWPLVESQRRRHIAHFIHHSPRRLGHTAARISGKRFQIAPRALGVQDSERQRRLAGAGHAGYPDYLPKRYVYIYVLEVMGLGTAHLDILRHLV